MRLVKDMMHAAHLRGKQAKDVPGVVKDARNWAQKACLFVLMSDACKLPAQCCLLFPCVAPLLCDLCQLLAQLPMTSNHFLKAASQRAAGSA